MVLQNMHEGAEHALGAIWGTGLKANLQYKYLKLITGSIEPKNFSHGSGAGGIHQRRARGAENMP